MYMCMATFVCLLDRWATGAEGEGEELHILQCSTYGPGGIDEWYAADELWVPGKANRCAMEEGEMNKGDNSYMHAHVESCAYVYIRSYVFYMHSRVDLLQIL